MSVDAPGTGKANPRGPLRMIEAKYQPRSDGTPQFGASILTGQSIDRRWVVHSLS